MNFLQLNQDQTKVPVIGPEGPQREEPLPKLRDFKHSNLFHTFKILGRQVFTLSGQQAVLLHAFIPCRLDFLLSGLPIIYKHDNTWPLVC